MSQSSSSRVTEGSSWFCILLILAAGLNQPIRNEVTGFQRVKPNLKRSMTALAHTLLTLIPWCILVYDVLDTRQVSPCLNKTSLLCCATRSDAPMWGLSSGTRCHEVYCQCMGLEHSCSPRSNTSIKNQTASLNISNRQSCSRTLCSAQLKTALSLQGHVATKSTASASGIHDSSVGSTVSLLSCVKQHRGFTSLKRYCMRGFCLGVDLGSDSTPFDSCRWQYKPRSSVRMHAFHDMDSKDTDIHVIDRWMPATKTYPASMHHPHRRNVTTSRVR